MTKVVGFGSVPVPEIIRAAEYFGAHVLLPVVVVELRDVVVVVELLVVVAELLVVDVEGLLVVEELVVAATVVDACVVVGTRLEVVVVDVELDVVDDFEVAGVVRGVATASRGG